jgi:hypothetical protein
LTLTVEPLTKFVPFTIKVKPTPPATRTLPFASRVMVNAARGTFMLLIAVKECVSGS